MVIFGVITFICNNSSWFDVWADVEKGLEMTTVIERSDLLTKKFDAWWTARLIKPLETFCQAHF